MSDKPKNFQLPAEDGDVMGVEISASDVLRITTMYESVLAHGGLIELKTLSAIMGLDEEKARSDSGERLMFDYLGVLLNGLFGGMNNNFELLFDSFLDVLTTDTDFMNAYMELQNADDPAMMAAAITLNETDGADAGALPARFVVLVHDAAKAQKRFIAKLFECMGEDALHNLAIDSRLERDDMDLYARKVMVNAITAVWSDVMAEAHSIDSSDDDLDDDFDPSDDDLDQSDDDLDPELFSLSSKPEKPSVH